MTKVDISEPMVMYVLSSCIQREYEKLDMIFEENKSRDSEDPYNAEIELKVNGIELNFNNFIATLDKIWDEAVEDAARDLITKKINFLMADLDVIECLTKRIVTKCESNRD